MKKVLALALAFIVVVALTGCASVAKPDGTVAMPASSSDLEGENYQDVIARLDSAGFSSVTSATIDDLVFGWLTKDGEVESVSVDGATDFEADSTFAKDAKIVVTYHTFPPEASDTAGDSGTDAAETPDTGTSDPDATVMTAANNAELKAVLGTKDNADPRIVAFSQKYAGRTIQFDGFTWDWVNLEGYDSIYYTNIYVGDVKKNANSQVGPTFRVERYQWPSFTPALNRMNAHVTAKVDGWDDDQSFFLITLTSIEER